MQITVGRMCYNVKRLEQGLEYKGTQLPTNATALSLLLLLPLLWLLSYMQDESKLIKGP